MDALSRSLDYHGSVNAGLEKNGVKGFWERTKFGLTSSDDEKMRMAIHGGYKDRADLADYYLRQYEGGSVKASVGRQGRPITQAEFPGISTGKVPVPGQRPTGAKPVERQAVMSVSPAPPLAAMGQNPYRIPTREEVKDAFKIDLGFKKEGEQAGQAVADGGRQAGEEIEKSAAFIKIAGFDVSTAIASAADKLLQAASAINRMPVVAGGASATGVNANTGRSMPAAAGRPAGTGRQ
jgi:hypothetical protein